MTYSDLDLMKICAVMPAGDALRCPLATCDERFEVPSVPVSNELGAVFGLSGDTLARVHGEQVLKRALADLRHHLSSHSFEDWLPELREAQEALMAQVEMWSEVQRR